MKTCTKCGKNKDAKKDYNKARGECKICQRKKDAALYLRRKEGKVEPAVNRSISYEFPERELYCAIIRKAADDWRAHRYKFERPGGKLDFASNVAWAFARRESVGKPKFASPHDELLAFFTGEWYYELCTWLEIDPNGILEELGIGFRHKVADKLPINERDLYA